MNKIALIDIAERMVSTFIQATGAALATGAGRAGGHVSVVVAGARGRRCVGWAVGGDGAHHCGVR
jgi:hypothetical protein